MSVASTSRRLHRLLQCSPLLRADRPPPMSTGWAFWLRTKLAPNTQPSVLDPMSMMTMVVVIPLMVTFAVGLVLGLLGMVGSILLDIIMSEPGQVSRSMVMTFLPWSLGIAVLAGLLSMIGLVACLCVERYLGHRLWADTKAVEEWDKRAASEPEWGLRIHQWLTHPRTVYEEQRLLKAWNAWLAAKAYQKAQEKMFAAHERDIARWNQAPRPACRAMAEQETLATSLADQPTAENLPRARL